MKSELEPKTINPIIAYKADGGGLCPDEYTVTLPGGVRRTFYDDQSILDYFNQQFPHLLFKLTIV